MPVQQGDTNNSGDRKRSAFAAWFGGIPLRTKIIGGGIGLGAIAALILIAALSGGPSAEDPQLRNRNNTIALATDYITLGEFDRALNLLENLLLQDPRDPEVIALRDEAISQKRAADELARLENLRASQNQNSNSQHSSRNPELEALQAQRAAAEAEAALAASRERAALAAQRAEEARLQQELAAQRAAELERQRQAEEAARRAEEERLARLSAEEQAKQRRINELLQQAATAQQEGKFIEARNRIQEAINLDSQQALPFARLASNYFAEDAKNQINLDQAINNAERARRLNPNLWEPYFTLGQIYTSAQQYDRAIDQLKNAANLNTTNAQILFELGNAQFLAGRFADAKQSYEASIALDSSNERAFFNLGSTYERLADPTRALDAYRRAIAVKANYASAYNRTGELLLAKGDLDAAVTNLRRAVELEDTVRHNRSFANALYMQRRYSEALPLFQKVVQAEPNVAVNNYNLATVLLDLNKPEDAVTYAAKAVQLDSSRAEYTYTLGLCAARLGGTSQAEEYFLRSIQQNSGYIKPRIELGALYLSLNDPDKALTQLLAAYRIDQTSVEANNNLATAYRIKGLFADSLSHAQKAIAARPNDASLRFTMALTQFGQKDYAAARSSLEACINLDGTYWEAYHRLGEVLIAMDRKDDAKTILNRLLSLNPNYPAKETVSQLVSSL